MSLRAALTQAVGIVRRRFIRYKNYPAARPQGDKPIAERPRARKAFVDCQAGRGESFAAQLRRNAALRLITARYCAGGRSGSRWGRMLPGAGGFAFVGLTLAAGESGLLVVGEDEDEVSGNEQMQRLQLDTCCSIVRDIFGREESGLGLFQPEENDFPSDITSYDISRQLLGKGTSASIYAARLAHSWPIEKEFSKPAAIDEEVSHKDEGGSDEEEGDWEMISIAGGLRGRAPADLQDADTEEGSSLGSLDGVLVADEEALDETMEDAAGQNFVREDADEKYDLALKMMFNYDIASNTMAISHAFEREYLPLWPALSKGSFGDVQWENGHRAKKKAQRFLPSHPNTVEVYHAFVAPTVTHDLEEARTLFPAALPLRLHNDGMGRNQTMFLILKRYDMTLDEYNQTVGCPSQHVAMVIVAQLLEGVSHLVDYGIAHRDLKTNNILVDLTEGIPSVVIADYGCCLADYAVGLNLPYPTRHTEIGGNSALMAPEVKSAKPGPDATINYTKSDAWAVGAIGYEILGLPNPFYRHDDGRQGIDSALYDEGDLPELPDNTHPGLAKVVSLLLKKSPKMRPTARVAANMLHLSLWQPPVFTFTWLEGSALIPAQLSIQQHLASWLLHMTAGMLCQRSSAGQSSTMKGCTLWLDTTEYQLCNTFMSRVTRNDLLRAVNHLVE